MPKRTFFVLSICLFVIISFLSFSFSYLIKSFNPKILGESVQLVEKQIVQKENINIQKFPKEEYLVTKVIDGDTVVIDTGEHIRLIGIDAPEISKKDCYSFESKNYLSKIIENKKVTLEKDKSEKDRYGRLLRYIYLDNLFVNKELVEKGYAKAYAYKPDTKYSALLEITESLSQNNNTGIWGSCF